MNASAPSSRRVFPAHAVVAGVIVVALAALLVWTPQRGGHDWGGDFALYLLQAQSLASGTPAESPPVVREMMRRGDNALGPHAYLWGYPLLLAPWFALGVDQPEPLKRLVGAFFVGAVVICLALFRRRGETPSVAVAAAALVALHPVLLGFRDQLLSDLPYLMLSLLALLAVDGVRDAMRRGRSPTPLLLGAGAAIAAATAVRHNGALLGVVLGAVLAVESLGLARRRGWLAVLRCWALPAAAMAAVTLPVLLLLPSTSDGYLPFLGPPTREMLLANLAANLRTLGAFLGQWQPLVWGCLVVPAVAIGVAARLRRDYALVLYPLLTLALYTAWAPSQGPRYLYGVAVPLAYFAVSGWSILAAVLLRRAPAGVARRPWGVVVAGIFAAFLAGQSLRDAQPGLEQRTIQPGPYTANAEAMFAHVEQHTAEDAWIAFFKPRVMYLQTGRRSFMTRDPERLSEADLVVLHVPSGSYDQVSPDHPVVVGLQRVFYNTEFVIYRPLRHSSSNPAPSTSATPGAAPASAPAEHEQSPVPGPSSSSPPPVQSSS
jgi:hypothetical protein